VAVVIVNCAIAIQARASFVHRSLLCIAVGADQLGQPSFQFIWGLRVRNLTLPMQPSVIWRQEIPVFMCAGRSVSPFALLLWIKVHHKRRLRRVHALRDELAPSPLPEVDAQDLQAHPPPQRAPPTPPVRDADFLPDRPLPLNIDIRNR
jgi:hypothetical protein